MHKHLLLLVNNLSYFVSHRLPIALAAEKAGFSVSVAYGDLGGTNINVVESLGIRTFFIPMRRSGINPFAELLSLFAVWRLFRKLRPDVVHLVTIKPYLYGGIAARLAGVPAVVSAIAGLGFVFVENGGTKAALLRGVLKPLFRMAMGHKNQLLIFQNHNDLAEVMAMTSVAPEQTRLFRGSGVDLAAYPVLPEPEGLPVVAMASRLLRDKGVGEFVEAARILKNRSISAQFWLIGQPDIANPASVTDKKIAAWKVEGIVECLGYRKDVPSLYSQAHIVTLPSYYREGLPKSLIEAAACGRAVVTTDVSGCRDAIEPNVTGLLVPPRDAIVLADAIERLLKDSTLRQAMGKAGRTLAEREFGIEKVVDAHLHIYQQLLDACSSQ